MRLNRISCAAVAATLAATLATSASALAAPGPGHPAAAAPASRAVKPHPHKTVVKGRFVVGLPRSDASRYGTAGPQQEETFTCSYQYGITSSTPVYNKKNKLTGYDVDFGITFQCPLPMLMTAGINITDLTTHKNLGPAAQTQFAEEIDVDSSATLPVNNNFMEFYNLAAMLPPGFVWISWTSPVCAGIGTPDADCPFVQPYNTDQ